MYTIPFCFQAWSVQVSICDNRFIGCMKYSMDPDHDEMASDLDLHCFQTRVWCGSERQGLRSKCCLK